MPVRLNRAEETASTWIKVLQARAAESPVARAYTFLAEGEEESESLTYAELEERARALAACLQGAGAAGQRALLLYPPGLDFIIGFLGCLYADCVAVPAYPPRSARTFPRLRAIAKDAGPSVILTTSDLLSGVETLGGRLPELAGVQWLATDTLDVERFAGEWREPEVDGDTLAFLQYTSGSTALPKGVMVTHGNLLHNEEMIQAAFRQSERSVIAGWLPLYHDMGLIGNVLQPLYAGAPCVLMSPVAFLQRPLRWLRAISRYQATTSGGPNFAYDLCVKRIPPAERHGLDLSCWEVAFNGAEPVRADTLERFAEAFAPFGFRRKAFYPCYGLAEATLFVSGGRVEEPPVVAGFRSGDLERDRVAPADLLEPSARSLVGCGTASDGQEIAIADPETGLRCPPDQVGEIWVAGPSVAGGYWGRQEESERTFRAKLADDPGAGPFLRTGDLGFLSGGELFVAGRLKDLIILRGRNLYPQDLELTAERSHPALRPGCGAAFSVDLAGEERLVIVFELERRQESEAGPAAESVRRAVAEEHEAQVHEVVLVRMGSVPKTSSGKVQRHACRAAYLDGSMEALERSPLVVDEAEESEAGAELDCGLLLSLPSGERRGALDPWLRAAAAKVLGLPPSRIDSARPLTTLGLDSLGAIEIKSQVEETLGVSLSLATLLEGASLAGLAVEVLEQLAEAAPEERAAQPAPLGEETGEFPLSYGQWGLWYLHRLAPESLAYHLAGVGRVRGSLDPQALAHAFAALVKRHPALRTTFRETAEGPVQRVHEELAPEIVAVELGSGEDPEARLRAEIWRGFDLERGPLVRLGILRSPGDTLLFLAIHHIVADFGSLAVIARDLGTLYALETGSSAPALAPLDLRYADFVRWQREWLAAPQGERLWAYWQETLAPAGTEPPYLDLPSDRPRPAVQTWAGDGLVFRLDAALAADLQTLARQRGATLYMTLLAAFEAVLARYTGQSDLLIGSPTTGRSSGAVADLVGYFVNPVALRVALPAEAGFQAVLDEVRRVVVGAFQHQDFPFALLAERLQPQRDSSRPPLFDVLFTFQKARGAGGGLGGFALGEGGTRLLLGGVEVAALPLKPVAAPYSLDFMIAEVEDGLGALLRFNSGLFDGATIERLAGHYQALLRGVLDSPGTPVRDLPLLTSGETRQLLVEWTRPGPDWPRNVSLHGFFEAQARRTPDATALIGGTERLTYRELDERSERMARRLRFAGVGPETRVGIFLQRTPRLLISMLGVLKAGGAYVPLDPAYPRERVEVILGDAGAPVVVTEGELVDALPAHLEARIIGADEEGPADLPPLASLPVCMEQLAYVIYTSGSTGRPKGVAIEHRSVSALMHWSRESFRPEELAGVLASTSICFDLSVFELFGTLAWGGTVILAENALALPELPARDEVTLIDTVPSAMAELVHQGAVPKSVKTVNLAGEPLRGALARQVLGLGTVERLLNLYGPSEDTTFSTVAEVGTEGEPTIGRILPNSYGYVLDRNLSLIPVGVPGELYLGGVGISRGYLGRPDLTAERYVPDPFAKVAGARLYKTDDLVRYLADGELEYLGRLDHQVKVRGFRVELGEIEAALLAHPTVQVAAVLALGEGGERRLVAYVVSPESAGLRGYLKEKLPEYMVPSAVVALESLPLTPNGKVDRRALARIAPGWTAEVEGQVAPRDPVEWRLAEIWCAVLGLERVGVQDDFFDLGGHSLLATQLASRVREAFGVELPLRRLFEMSTIESLAQKLGELGVSAAVPAPPVEPVDRSGDLLLSFAQERMWFLDRFDPGSPLYNIPTAARFSGRLDLAALSATLGQIVRRHEALRTVFAEVDGRPVQRILPWRPFDLPLVDFSALPVRDRNPAAKRLLREEARRPFDLAWSVPMRGVLVRLGQDEHVLALTFHHIASDGWSTGVFLHEMSALYGAAVAERPSPLPELAMQYADFAAWQRQWLQGEALEGQLAYWRSALAGLPPALDLPTDRPRPAVRGSRGACLPFALTGHLAGAVRSVAQREEVTPFIVLLAGLQALLSRMSGQEDLAVGSPVANRNRLETEPLIGCFVNTLVLRGELAGDPTFRELLRRARGMALDAYAHQDVPFERLVEDLAPPRDPSRTPLFQVSLALLNAPAVPLALPGLRAELLHTDAGVSRFDLTFLLQQSPEGFEGPVEYSVDLFDAAIMERLLSHFETLLSRALADPERRLSELPLLGSEEARQLLGEWTRNRAEWPEGVLLHEFFEAQAARTPEAAALIGGTERLSYRELNERADRMARRLRAAGVGPETRVGIFLRRTPLLPIAMLGVLKAGGAYVPLDPAYPRERVDAILGDSGAPVVVTEGALINALPPSLEALLVRADGEGPADLPELEPLPLPVRPGHLAYVIYTSGSTGRPKGVAIEHRSVSALMHWSRESFRAEELAGVLASTSICFDMSVFELFATLALGGTVILADNALALADLPARDEVTLIDTVPSAMAELLRQGAVPPSVRTVNLGGEPLRGALARQVLELGTVNRLLNLYGPSEDTTFSTIAEVGVEGEPTIGRVLTNSWGYVLDIHLRPVPVGVPGELYLGGVGLSRGYLSRPDLTAERYVPDPYSESPGGRLYRTGDLVRYREDGELEYLGRLDHQVKVRGFRVELGEIEAVLLAHSALQDAAVLALGEEGERRLVAYVVVQEGAEVPEQAELRGYVKEKLPEYMVPSAWVVLDALPLTPNGKVDRRLLARIEPGWGSSDAEGYMAPRTPVEERLAAIWSEVLGLERVGVQDDFFDLGGHSLLAAQIVSRVRQSFGYELPLRQIFETSTVEGLARVLEEAGAVADGATASALEPVDCTGDLPLSFAQERLWFLDQLEPGSAVYNMPVAVRLSGPLQVATLAAGLATEIEALRGDGLRAGAPPLARRAERGEYPLSFAQERLWFLDQLEPGSPLYNIAASTRLSGILHVSAFAMALGEIVRRHEALRTVFAEMDGRPVQRIAPWTSFDLPVVDLSSLPEESRRSAAERLTGEEGRTPFDLGSGRLVRALLLRLGREEHILALSFHHIASDGWSTGVFLRELSVLYRSFTIGRPSPLPELAIQYADFAVWQRQWLRGEVLESQLTYWRDALAGLPPALDLPLDHPRPPVRGTRGSSLPVLLAGDLVRSVRAFAQREGATPFMVLLAGFQALLSRLSGQDDLAVGSPVANRNRIETEPLIGFFVNMLVLRGELGGDPGFRELLSRALSTALGAYAHQDVPFEKLVEELAPQRDPSRTPLFQISLALQNTAGASVELPSLKAEPLGSETGGSRFDLTLLLGEAPNGFAGTVEYALDLFDRTTIQRLLSHFETLLSRALADPERRLSELPLLGPEEARQLLGEWTRDRAEWPEGVLLHEFFEAQAARTPEAAALIGGTERLSYRELNERADRMARRLRAAGVGPETRVGIFLRRTPLLPIAMLGVLKAGGAYVPLDPAYPRERVDAILGDSGASVVVTEGALIDALPPNLEALLVRADEEGPADLPELEPLPVRPGHLAYVIYTSGSTGRPKGVAIEHRSVSALMHWSRESFRAEELAGVLASTSICFDMSVFELFATLAWGGTVILADNALALADLPARDEVTLIDTVPSAMAELLRQGAVPPSVRTVNLGGEPLRGALARQVLELGTVNRLLNLYGPSEDTTFSTVAEVGTEGEPTIGRVLTNSWGYVLDIHLRPVPVGVPGELYLGGVGLSRGYLSRPDLTAERYVPDPFAEVPGGRLYQTGDLVRYREDGELEYLGRLDHQVKVRGFRVELGEIEAVLLAHPSLQDTAVLALGEEGERRLVAYVVVLEGAEPEPAELRGYVKDKLPEYMVPSAWVVLDALPLTPNGKVDRRLLARIEPGWGSSDAEGYMAPRTPVEERLAAIWSEVLGVGRVGVQDDFFDLGGHSLLATQIVSRVRESFGYELPLRQIFESSTVEGLARVLEESGAVAGGPTASALEPVDCTGDLPLSFAQERLWFLDQLEPGSAAYNLPVAVRLSGPLRVTALAAGLERIVARHEVLRARFESREGRPVQVIGTGMPMALVQVDLAGLPPERREAEALAICAREAARPFDLSLGLLMRPCLLRLEPEEWICLVVMHHIVTDGWSLGLFVRELAAAYAALSQGSEPAEPELPVQYADFAIWQRQWLQGETLQAELAWWQEQLAGAPPLLELPLDHARPAVQTFRGARERVQIPAGLCEDLERLGQPLGATAYMVLLAVFTALLARLSGQEDVVVGSPVAGRTRGETEGLIGFFVNTLALRVDLSQDPSFDTLLSRVRERVLSALTHQDLPFEKMVEELAPERNLSHSPVFQVLLAVQTTPLEASLPGLRLKGLDVYSGIAKLDLTLDLVQEADGGFSGWLEYNRDLFEAATVKRLAGQLGQVLEAVAAWPALRLSELPLSSPAERQRLLEEWSRTPGQYRRAGTVHGLFAEQALKTPQKAAVVSRRETLTFRDLDALSSRLAQRIKEVVSDREPSVSPE